VTELPTHGRRSARRSVQLGPRISQELKDRIDAAATARGMTLNRWLEQLLEQAAPPLLDVDVHSPAASSDSQEEAAVA
jgi:HicB-like protein involved in pilus formation